MAIINVTNQTAPATPLSGTSSVYVDSTSKLLSTIDDTGTIRVAAGDVNGPVSTTSGHFVLWNNASGTLVSDAGYATVPVTAGGTGDTSFTAYTLLCAGTTTTGNIQNVVSVGTTGQVLISNGAAALPTFQTFSVPRFTSSNQVITAAGSLTLAHGLGAVPTLIRTSLVNTSAELGYSIGDVVDTYATNDAPRANQGVIVVPDATNLNVRYGAGSGSGTPVFSILNKTTGVTAIATNANWDVVFRAWVL